MKSKIGSQVFRSCELLGGRMKKMTVLLVFCLGLLFTQNSSALPADEVNWIDESEAAALEGELIAEEGETVVDALAYSLINYRLKFADVFSDDDIFFLPSDEEINFTEQLLQEGGDISRLPRLEGLVRLNVSIDPQGEDIELLPLRFCLDDGSETCENVLVWDSEAGNFTEVLELKNLVKERSTGVVLSFLLPPAMAKKMKEQGYNEPTAVKIKSWIDVFNPMNESGMSEPVELAEFFMVSLPEDLEVESSVQKSQSKPNGFNFIEVKREGKANGEIKINPVFTTALELSLHPSKKPMKFYAGANGYLGVNIFGMGEFKFCEALADAGTTVGDGQDSADTVSANAFVKFLTFTLWSQSWSREAKIEGNKTYRKEKGVSKTIMVGWVPVSLEAGAAGELGVQWVFQMYGGGTLFQAKAGPFVDAGAYAKAAVNLLVVQAGIKGQLSLIRDELWLDVRMNPWQKKLGGSVYNIIWGPGGSFGPFVKWWEVNCEWRKSCKRCCWTSWCWWYPSCSSGWKEKYWPVASFSTFQRTDTIWSFGSWNDLQ
jgi:hypothetical protein